MSFCRMTVLACNLPFCKILIAVFGEENNVVGGNLIVVRFFIALRIVCTEGTIGNKLRNST